MRLLLDTHAFLWWIFGEAPLPRRVREAIAAADQGVYISAVTALEITMKFRIGKLPHAAVVACDVAAIIADEGFIELPVTLAHAQLAGSMAGEHRDPFDRLLMAQALLEGCLLVSSEAVFDGFGVRRLW